MSHRPFARWALSRWALSRWAFARWALCALLLVGGCLEVPDGGFAVGSGSGAAAGAAGGHAPCGSVPTGLSIMTWNLSWFGDPTRGPQDDERQLQGALELLQAQRADLIALQEVSSIAQLQRLVDGLATHAASWTDHDWPQQMALLHDRARFTVQHMSTLADVPHAGRPPLHVELFDLATGQSLSVIVVHAKAGAQDRDHERRFELATALAEHVRDGGGQAAPIVLAGDLNDGLTRSIVEGLPSPYRPLLDVMLAPTSELEQRPDARSTVWGTVIDHVLITTALTTTAGRPRVETPGARLAAETPDFAERVSDHYPVVLRLDP